MNPLPSPPASFDTADVERFLHGTWQLALEGDDPGIGWLHFNPDGRSVQFLIYRSHPDRRLTMRGWYTVESPAVLRFRLRPGDPGWIRTCSIEGDGFLLGADDVVYYPCTRLAPQDLPEWFPGALTVQLAKMIAVESPS